jgi:diaminopimelate epimerase
MQLEFSKYHGTGNDFIIADNRNNTWDKLLGKQIKSLCDRRFGIGADGLILLKNDASYDFAMKYYNSDGREGTMCGNGGRCIVKYAHHLGIIKSNYKFSAIDGMHEASIDNNGSVSLKMNDVDDIRKAHSHFIINTGSPHMVILSEDVMHLDIYKKGREIRYNKEFEKEGINVNFVQQLEQPDHILVRTYERGVEDETLSCGTGVTAAALVCHHNDNGFNRVEVQTPGGFLSVEFEKVNNTYRNIWLNGPAVKVFQGMIELNLQ